MDSVKRQVEDSFTSDAKKVRRSRWGQAPEGPAAGDAVTLPEQGTLVPVGVAQAAMAPMGHMPHMGHMGNMMTMVSPMAMMGGMDLNAAAAAAREALEKAKKAAMFQKQIQEQMLRLKGGAVGAADAQQHARKLILDEFGRELTEEGKVLPMKPQIVSTLKVNQNLTMEKDAKKIIGEERRKMQKAQRDAGSSRWFDSDLKPSKTISDRRKNAFKFVEKGTFVKQEERMNQIKKEIAVAKAENLVSKEEKKAAAKDEKVAETKEAKPVINKSKLKEVLLPVPDIEWWDSLLCEENMNPELPYVLKQEKITHLIEHPVQIKPRIEKTVTHTMHLTPQERKKLRRLRRQERTQQIRDKIKMGIIQPPPPKVKMSNLMRVLGDEAIADPSLVERKVKMQIEQRKKEHEARNESRKLPQQHLAAKKIQKWIEKDKDAVYVSLYRIKELTGKRCLFKIEMNAQQFQLTGICIICPGIGNLVVVEGGARAIKRYKKLMMKRIKWREDRKDDEASDSEEDEEQEDNQDCVCIWDGVVQNRGFKNWKSLTCKTDNEARKTLQDRGCEHYWDMLHRFRNVQEDI